jgi:hypothetical protein
MPVALPLALAILASPQELSVQASQESAPEDQFFRAGFAVYGAETWATEFYTRPTGGDGAEWVVRRSLIREGQREQISWTNDSRCPVAREIAYSLNFLPLGAITTPDLKAEGPALFSFPASRGPTHDGPSYGLWGLGSRGGFAEYRVSASVGGVADWVEAAELAMRQCWDREREGS